MPTASTIDCRASSPSGTTAAVKGVRDASAQTLLQQQVTNPFYIDNFASLRTSDPVLYERMANNAFFQARTTQRQNLIRAFPQLSGNPLIYANNGANATAASSATCRSASSRRTRSR